MVPSRRYDQASAVPYRRRGERVEFCLITSYRKRRWGFPKGVIDPGETEPETAVKEAWEEAGLHGRVVGEPLGSYRYRKWDKDLLVVVLLMEVEREDASWPEAAWRERRWMELAEADRMLGREVLRPFLHEAAARIT